MAGAGDLNGMGDEGEGKAIRSTDINTPEAEKKPEPAASTQAAARTRQPAASVDMPDAGDFEGPGEEDEGEPLQIADISARESEKKPEPAASTKVSASCTREREPPAWTMTQLAEREQQQRKLTEARMAERYTLPVEVFTAGSSSGCALIGSIQALKEAARTRRPFYVMPYLPPGIAVEIQSEMDKGTRVRALLMNPDVLATKVAVTDEINAEIRLWDQEDPERAKGYHHGVASELMGFRAQMQNQLLFTYAAKGEREMAHKYLKQLYPELYKTDSRMEQTIANLKCMSHCSDEGELDDIIYDIFSLLSLEERVKLLYKSVSLPASEKTYLVDKMAAEPSLIGATNKEMAVSALKRLLLDLISCAVVKGHLANETGSPLASRDAVQKLRKDGHVHINGLIRMLEKKTLNFDEMSSTINLLKQVAIKVGGQGLETLCDAFIESCKQNNDKECREALSKIEQEYTDICSRLERISELMDLILLIESSPDLMNK